MTHFIVKWPIFFLITQSNKQLYFQHSVCRFRKSQNFQRQFELQD